MPRIIASLLFLSAAAPALAQSPAELCDRYAGHPWEPDHAGRGVEWGAVIAGPAVKACREALTAEPDSPEILYRLGRTLMQIGSPEGLSLVHRSAEAGYPPAETAYGTAYMQADGVAIDYAVALEWLTKASDHGHAIGINNLALLYQKGATGVAADPAAARALYAKAAEAGYPLAMYNLALDYEYPTVGEPDYDASFAWASKALAAGHFPALRGVARAYDYGKGVAEDHAKALEWWVKGAEAGDPISQVQAAVAYSAGRGTEVNLAASEKWLRASARQGYPKALLYLGDLLISGRKGKVSNEGIRWLERAGAAGEVAAYIKLAEHYIGTRDPVQARTYAEAALAYGNDNLKAEARSLLTLIARPEN